MRKRFPLLAAVGEATARSVGTPVALRAEPARSDVLAQQFPEGSGSVLVVQGNLADNQLSDDIEAKGGQSHGLLHIALFICDQQKK